MYQLLNRINEKLGDRYKTVETNIKAKSNSFYESLLALLEGLARLIAKEQSIKIESDYDTLIGIIRVKGFEEFCLNNGFSKDDYENLFALAKSVNSHKHADEKQVTLESIIEFLNGTFKFASMYYKYKFNENAPKFEISEINDLFGKTEKEIKELALEKRKLEESLLKESNVSNLLQSDLERVKQIQDENYKKYSNLEEQKNNLLNQLNELKDIKLSSLDEKMNKIIMSLNDQIQVLKTVNATLQKTNEILETRNFSGRNVVHL